MIYSWKKGKNELLELGTTYFWFMTQLSMWQWLSIAKECAKDIKNIIFSEMWIRLDASKARVKDQQL